MRNTLVRWDPFRDLVSIQDELNGQIPKVETARPKKIPVRVA